MTSNVRLSFSFLLLLALIWPPEAAKAQAAEPQFSSTFTGRDAQSIIAQALSQAGAGEDLQISISQIREDAVITSGSGIIAAQTDGLQLDKAHRRWEALLLLKTDGKNLAPVKLSGRYDEMTRVPVLKNRLQPTDIITENDIDWSRQASERVRHDMVTDVGELVGKSPRHVISPGRPIRLNEIAGPSVINKGAQVTMFYKSRNLEIKTLGEALEPGAKGDVIKVRNTASKAIVQATVESAGHVVVSSPESTSAEAM